MPRSGPQQFAFGGQQGVYDLMEGDSDCSSLTDEYNSGDSDSLDFGSVTYEGKEQEANGPNANDSAYGEVGEDSEDDGSEWDKDEYPPLDLNDEALTHIASCHLPGNHGDCVEIKTLPRGDFNEIRVLEFDDGWSCIARFARDRNEKLSVLESAYATMKYVREHMRLPVPEIYFVNFDPTHVVGAPFILMERMPGSSLRDIWEEIGREHEVAVIKQVADVLAELSRLEFDKIGSINIHGEIGELHFRAIPPDAPARGRFNSLADYMCSFMSEDTTSPEEVKALYPEMTNRIRKYLADQTDDPIYNPPFRLIHPDFDLQNLLFTWPNRLQPPKLSGIIDWDYAFTCPFYYLFDYPLFIQDRELVEEWKVDWPYNKILRQTFARRIALNFPKDSEARADARECFRQKCYLMNSFRSRFMQYPHSDAEAEFVNTQVYGDDISGRNEGLWMFPYNRRLDYTSDSKLESGDEDEDVGFGD